MNHREEKRENRALVKAVFLEKFRNYRHAEVDLDSAFTILAGSNGQGKTNFLEGLHLLATTRLLRGQRDAEAILEGEQVARVSAELSPMGTILGLTLSVGHRKRASINGMNLLRAADLLGRLPSVCISTSDLEIVRGEPSERRQWLDLELSSLYPAYLRHFTLYRRALDQRNALLKIAQDSVVTDEAFEPWEVALAENGEWLRSARQAYVRDLSARVTSCHAMLADGEAATVRYVRKDERSPLEAISGTRQQDIARGTTTIGPHRDDLAFEVNGRDAKLFGSQGQQRSLVIALKMASLDQAETILGGTPLLLLDDILSDLDENRRSCLVHLVLEKRAQTVLTCTEAIAAGKDILNVATVFQVKQGTLKRL